MLGAKKVCLPACLLHSVPSLYLSIPLTTSISIDFLFLYYFIIYLALVMNIIYLIFFFIKKKKKSNTEKV